MNKTAYSSNNVLALKDSGKAYPTVTPTSILKWRYVAKEEKEIPLTSKTLFFLIFILFLIVNVWPSTSGNQTTVPVEFEKHCDFDLHDVDIQIPIPYRSNLISKNLIFVSAGNPVVGEVTGSTDYDAKKGILHWRVPLIESSASTGSMEFTVPAAHNSAFFPVRVSFRSGSTFCALQVVEVTAEGSDQAVDFTQDTSLTVEQYDIE
jgi:hypothetical protein